jgi:hypothetical protein
MLLRHAVLRLQLTISKQRPVLSLLLVISLR